MNSKWTHWFTPLIVPGYAEKAIILNNKPNFLTRVFGGQVKIQTSEGFIGWVRNEELFIME